MQNYSVLMSVYHKEKAEYLKLAMQSMFNQTILTNDFVLVCDGPLTTELDSVIDEMKALYPDVLNIVRLSKNGGLGNALNEGLKRCKNEFVARMDSDDISLTDRCERQIAVFEQMSDISLCSGTIGEFESDPVQIAYYKTLPETNDKIIKYSRKRCPFNHPCVMYKKSAVLSSGGYQDFYLLEDYYLWVRMLAKGYKGYNLKSTILLMRTGSGMYDRRGGVEYAKSQRKLFKYMKDIKYISKGEFLMVNVIRSAVALAPTRFRKQFYSKILRISRCNIQHHEK